MKRTIAIDFDGVIHKYSKGWQDGSIYDDVVEGAWEAIIELLKEYNVFIFTSRDPQQVFDWYYSKKWAENLPTMEVILKKAVFWDKEGKLGVTNRKLPAIVYIDDRGIKFRDWRSAKEMIKLEVAKEKVKGVLDGNE